MSPGLLVSQKLAVVRVSTLPCLVTIHSVCEADEVVGWLLFVGGATWLCPLATSVPSLLALGGSCHSCYRSWGIHRGLISRSHGGNSLAAGALGIQCQWVSVFSASSCASSLWIFLETCSLRSSGSLSSGSATLIFRNLLDPHLEYRSGSTYVRIN